MISLSPTRLSKRTLRRSCVVFSGLSAKASLNIAEELMPSRAEHEHVNTVGMRCRTNMSKPSCRVLDSLHVKIEPLSLKRMHVHCNTKGHSTWRKRQEAEQTALRKMDKRSNAQVAPSHSKRPNHHQNPLASSCRNFTLSFVDAGISSFCT